MKHLGRYILTIAILLAALATARGDNTFSTMTSAEISALLDRIPAAADAGPQAVPAKGTVMPADSMTPLPVDVTALEMLTKVYGCISPRVSKHECVDSSRRIIRLTPLDDNGTLWLDTDGGYRLNYYGLVPDVSAMARFDGDNESLSDFGYFFLFPYAGSSRRDGMKKQTDFCGTLLQEMADMGLPMDLNTATDDLFEAVGDYQGSLVDVRLLDDRNSDGSGRYILILSVEPNAFTAADDVAAL